MNKNVHKKQAVENLN